MNRQRIFLYLGGVFLLAGLALVIAGSNPSPGRGRGSEVSSLPTAHRPLLTACSAKAPNGLAQCGSQASSCKNCHEVKGEDPVNSQGEWHVSHAFGDFCEFCHGGNVQATAKDAAHQGLIQPLGDLKANCSSCHDDYEAKAQTYAVALGVTLNSGGSSPAQPPAQPSGGSAQLPAQPSGSGSAQPPAQPPSASQPSAPPIAPAAAPGEIIDYAAQYDASQAAPISTGNIVVAALLGLTVLGGGAFIYWNEKRLRTPAPGLSPVVRGAAGSEQRPFRPITAEEERQPVVIAAEASGDLSPELAKLLPVLQSLDPRTLRALRIILSDRKRGEELLQSLSLINFTVLEEMKRLDKRELSLLLALASET